MDLTLAVPQSSSKSHGYESLSAVEYPDAHMAVRYFPPVFTFYSRLASDCGLAMFGTQSREACVLGRFLRPTA
jgi:hypothetical protein